MDRQEEADDDLIGKDDHRFYNVEGVATVRGRNGRFVMHEVDVTVYWCPVQESMCPVKPGVVKVI